MNAAQTMDALLLDVGRISQTACVFVQAFNGESFAVAISTKTTGAEISNMSKCKATAWAKLG